MNYRYTKGYGTATGQPKTVHVDRNGKNIYPYDSKENAAPNTASLKEGTLLAGDTLAVHDPLPTKSGHGTIGFPHYE